MFRVLYPLTIFFLNPYQAHLPWYGAILIWIVGVGCLWASRYTSRFFPVWGDKYYIFSAIVRPLGIILISFGLLEALAVKSYPDYLDYFFGFLFIAAAIILIINAIFTKNFFIPALLMALSSTAGWNFSPYVFMPFLVFWGTFCFGIWAILKLGIRQSLFFRKIDDPLVMDGPYALVRHPQLFSAIMLAIFSGFFTESSFGAGNTTLFCYFVWLITYSEEEDLKTQFNKTYECYIRAVPRLLPRLSFTRWRTKCPSCGAESSGWIAKCHKCEKSENLEHFVRPRIFGCMAWLLAPAVLLVALTLPVMEDKQLIYIDAGFKHRQAKNNLGIIFTCQLAYFGEKNTYSSSFEQINWAPEGHNRYAFCLGRGSYLPPRYPPYSSEDLEDLKTYALKVCDEFAGSSNKGFTAMAIGNYDRDPAYDVWMINDAKEMKNIVNDLREYELSYPEPSHKNKKNGGGEK